MGVVLAALSDETASAAVPASLLVATVQDALRIAAGQSIATPAAILMKEVMQMMLLTKLKLATVFVAMVGVMGVLAASFFAPMRAAEEKPAEPNPAPASVAIKTLARKITHPEEDMGDVATLLHIKKQMCEVELQLEPHTQPSFTFLGEDVEVYKDGRKTKTYVGSSGAVDKPKRARVALLAADLDYLPLAGGHKNHCRMKITCGVFSDSGNAQGSTEIEVPKEVFDFSRVNCQAYFPIEAASATEMPLFYFGVNRSGETYGANTVVELFKKNPKADFLIVYLRVRKK